MNLIGHKKKANIKQTNENKKHGSSCERLHIVRTLLSCKYIYRLEHGET